ncbi:uncharacterized protein [Ptychodera flava]|uniref:uncharacterized protein n=1 Tax=Ptychodera flava TaxID=63121 RepID=UPI003969D0BE
MYLNLFRGHGNITTNGGGQNSSGLGGGGAGGRSAIYFWENMTYYGTFQSHGGYDETFTSEHEPGGPGTIFAYHMIHDHRTLIIENNDLNSEHVDLIKNYSDISHDSFKAWILPQASEHLFAGGGHDYHFEELQIYGRAHLAILTEPYDHGASIHFQHMIGDRTGYIHVGPNQVMDLEREFIDTPFSSYVYHRGYLGLAPKSELSYVFVHLEGTMDHVHDMEIVNGAELRLFQTGSTNRLPRLNFRFNGTVTVKANSAINASSPFAHPDQYKLEFGNLIVEGGGRVYSKNLRIDANSMTVDDGGHVSSDDGGHLAGKGPAPGVAHRLGNSGASHGGMGGRGGCDGFKTCRLERHMPYCNMYYPDCFGSGGAGSKAGIGGGILDINVAHELKVDGNITANSLDVDTTPGINGDSGGSGGSITIHAGALMGGHTGRIQTLGGTGDISIGGSGSGGRIAAYYANNVTQGFYNGNFDTYGGRVCCIAESGAAGTVFLKHTEDDYTKLLVDNNGRSAVWDEIENIGQRLDLTGGSYSASPTYTAANGITVTSSHNHYSSNSLATLFDQTMNSVTGQYFLTRPHYNTQTVTLTFDLKSSHFVNTVRVYPLCQYKTEFKIDGYLAGDSFAVTTNYVKLSTSCTQGSFLDIPLRRNADSFKFYLQGLHYESGSNTCRCRYFAMSEIEIFTEEVDVHDRYKYRELDSARTWIEPDSGTNSYWFDETHITGNAQVAVMPKDSLTSPVDVHMGHLHGDKTGHIHIGYAQNFTVDVAEADVPVNIRVYEMGQLEYHKRAFFQKVKLQSSGRVLGIEDLFVFDDGYVSFDTNSSLGNHSNIGELELKSLHVQDRGTFELISYTKHIDMSIKLTNLTVYGGGHFQSNDRFEVTADHLVAIYSGGTINLDSGGYYVPEDKGPGGGFGSTSGGSGGGHGGSGGRGNGNHLVGLAYGSIYEPIDYGCVGGYGNQYGELYFGDEWYGNRVLRRGLGGAGGGSLKIITRHMLLDGTITADGETPSSTHAQKSGGGAGGSLWIECEELDGYGSISVNAGSGEGVAGGGSGGRVAVYYQDMKNFNGTITAHGGSSSYEVGGSGTVYLEKRLVDTGEVIHKTLKVDNNGVGYPRAANHGHGDLRDLLNGDYVDISRSGGITWLWHHSDVYIFDEVHIHGKAHVAILTNTSTQEVLVRGGKMFGDRTGVLHVGQQQTFGFDWVDIYIPVNIQVYRYGHLELPRRAVMRDVWMEVNGTLADIEDFTVESGGLLYFWSYGSTRNQIDGVYQFVNMTIRADGKFELLTVADYNRMVLNLTSLMEVKAGGYVRTNDMLVIAENITIDVAGDVHADWSGHSASDGPGSGLDKPTPGSYSAGASGGAHGGRGGRWDNGLYSSVAYDSMYTPSQPGSGGGNVFTDYYNYWKNGGRGGGVIHLEVHDTLRVEGRLHANGEDGRHDSDGSGGGGAGGSIMAHVGHLDGSGTVEVNGGEAYLGGGGSGGRIAVYTDWYDFIGELQAYGGTTDHTDFWEGYGASGTVYVQDKSNQDDPIRKLILDNNQVYTEPSRVGELHKIRSAGYSVPWHSTSFTTYAGVVVSTTAVFVAAAHLAVMHCVTLGLDLEKMATI